MHAHDQFSSRAHIKMLVDVLQVFLNRPRANPERHRNFLVRHSLLEPRQDFLLPF